jgi:hypothetical protein
MKTRFLILCLVFFLMSCTEDEVIENVLTEIEVDEAYYYSREVVWAFASTPSGDLLSSEQLKNASTTILKSSSDVTEFDLTVLVFDDGATSDRFLVATYSYIPVKSIVRFAQAEPAPWASLQSQGKVSIDVRGQNVNSSSIVVSARKSLLSETLPTSDGGIRNSFNLLSNSDDFLVSGYRNSTEPVFKWITGVAPGQTINVDMVELMSFSRTIDILMPDQTFLGLTGSNGGMLSIALASTYRASGGTMKVGILDGFESYSMVLAKTYPKGGVDYFKSSPLPNFAPKPFPELNFSVTDSKITNFQFSISSSPSYGEYTWSFTNSNKYLGWVVFAPETKFPKLQNVASAIREKYPEFDFASLSHFRSMVTYRHDDFGYLDLIKERTESIRKPTQEYTFRYFNFQ